MEAQKMETQKSEALLDVGHDQPIDLLDPDPHHPVFSVREIATRLAREYRYANSCRYTVAQHSVHVSEVAGSSKLAALLHDMPEALLHDIPHPAKKMCPVYQSLEKNLEAAVEKRYGIDLSADAVSKADHRVYVTERSSSTIPGDGLDVDSETPVAEKILPIKTLPEGAAERMFIDRFNRLQDQS